MSLAAEHSSVLEFYPLLTTQRNSLHSIIAVLKTSKNESNRQLADALEQIEDRLNDMEIILKTFSPEIKTLAISPNDVDATLI